MKTYLIDHDFIESLSGFGMNWHPNNIHIQYPNIVSINNNTEFLNPRLLS